ncbi:kelch domain-containing protein 7A [Gasterosteus aculeatus]
MPDATFSGVQFDMQLLLKVSLSVAGVLLVSWAYKLYSSREEENIQLCVKDNKDTDNATCQNCKAILGCRSPPKHPTDDGTDEQPGPSDTVSASDNRTSDGTGGTPAEARPDQAEKKKEAFSMSYTTRDISMKGEKLHRQEPASNISFGSALNFPYPTESGMVSATGRRSPCFFQKLEGSVGVGRELRQDLERQGAFSSFLSKAEIKVEDANVVREGTGDQIVRGKIYDYYVESSSHSITDSNTALAQYERNCQSQSVELGSRGSSLKESPSPLSAIIMRDLVLPQGTVEAPSLPGSLKQRPPARPVLLRKESYLSAAEQSELSIPSLNTRAPTSNESISHSTGSKGFNVEEEDETAAAYLLPPAKTLDGSDLESLKSKLHLGNCLETLCLAKTHGWTSVRKAALGVMSDNYLQVLRDPNLYGRLMAGEREQIQKQRMRGRRFLMAADMDPQDWGRNAGGRAQDAEQRRTSSAVYYYDDHKDAWHTLCPIPQEAISKACAMCTMDNYLFVAVGCQGTEREMTPSKRVFCFNPLTSIWKEISPMNEARPRCKLAALEGYVYAIGGECLSSVERYDPRLDRWTFVAPLPNDTFAVAHHVTVSSGELFVSGGTLRYMLLRYSPKTDCWRPSLLVGSKDRTADMVAVGRFLYRFDVNPLLGVSVYRYHTVARLWYECSSKRLERCPAFQCVMFGGTIYCVSRQLTMRFDADEVSPGFKDESMSVLSAAKGILFPFVLSLPDKKPRQTSV